MRRETTALSIPTTLATVVGLAGIALAGMTGGLRLGLWSDEDPGAGLFPFFCAAMLVAFLLIRLARGRKGLTPVMEPGAKNPVRLALYVAALVTVALLFDALGFPLAAAIALLLVLISAEKVPPIRAVAISACMVAATVILFDYALNVPLPWGPLASFRFWSS